MGLFGNSSSQNGPPIQAVTSARAQGLSDHDIIDSLSKQGYSSIDIYNALNQADQSSGGQSQPQQAPPQQSQSDQDPWSQQAAQQAPQQQESWGQQPQQAPQSDQDPWSQQAAQQAPQSDQDPWSQQPQIVHSAPSAPPAAEQPQAEPEPAAPTYAPQAQQAPQRSAPQASVFGGNDASLDQIDQVAEAIIDEKWKQMKAYIEKIVDWKTKVEQRIVAIEENQKTLNEQIIGLQKSLVDKVTTYDRHITDVATEIKAMEKVFQKIIPSLTDNVNELSSVVHRMKDEQ